MQPHPASAAAAAVLVAQASVGVRGGGDKYTADGTSLPGGMHDVEQGMRQGGDVVNAAPLLRQQTFGPVRSLHPSHLCVFVLYGCTCVCVCTGCLCVCTHASGGLFMLSQLYMYIASHANMKHTRVSSVKGLQWHPVAASTFSARGGGLSGGVQPQTPCIACLADRPGCLHGDQTIDQKILSDTVLNSSD